MLHGKDYTPCPECAAENLTSRNACWKCGAVLPYTVNSAGAPRVTPGQRAVGRSEITRLLEQAELIVCAEEVVPEAVPPPVRQERDLPSASRLQRWLTSVGYPVKSRT